MSRSPRRPEKPGKDDPDDPPLPAPGSALLIAALAALLILLFTSVRRVRDADRAEAACDGRPAVVMTLPEFLSPSRTGHSRHILHARAVLRQPLVRSAG